MTVECPTVTTLNGKVCGLVSKPTGPNSSDVFNFLSVPYGRPPVNELRFKPPQKAGKWDGVLNASQTLVNCPQDVTATSRHDKMLPYSTRMHHDSNKASEDCLRLSIFTPDCNPNAKLPVMVWLTGGSYQRNTCGRTDGTALAGMNNCVVVVLNFRVNIFGFLHLGDQCTGNMGLLDVQLGLSWVKNEISAFGGDSDNVTLFGESSGSGMVHLLMLSPLSKGLFHKAILQSGVALSPFFLDPNPEVTKNHFLEKLGNDCDKKNDSDLLEYLQKMPLSELKKTFSSQLGQGVSFMPVVDGIVIPDSPEKIVKCGKFMQIPLILGCTDSEAGCLLTLPMFPNNFMTGPDEESVKKNFELIFFSKYPNLDSEMMYKAIKSLYFQDDDSPFKYLRMHSQFSGDGIFVVPTIITAGAHSATGQPTFLYHIRQQPDFNHTPSNGKDVLKKPNIVSCDHCDDLYFVWGIPFIPGGLNHSDAYFTEDEKELSIKVMRYFTNFALSSDPNTGKDVVVEWPKYDAINNNRNHLELQTPISAKKDLAMDKLPLFMKLLPN